MNCLFDMQAAPLNAWQMEFLDMGNWWIIATHQLAVWSNLQLMPC